MGVGPKLFHSQNLLVDCFPNGMTQPGSTNNHRAAILQGEGQGIVHVLPVGDLAVMQPTWELPTTNHANPENFVQIGPIVQKIFNIYWNTEHKLQTKQITLVPYTGMGRKFYPVFDHLTHRVSLLATFGSFKLLYTFQLNHTFFLRQSDYGLQREQNNNDQPNASFCQLSFYSKLDNIIEKEHRCSTRDLNLRSQDGQCRQIYTMGALPLPFNKKIQCVKWLLYALKAPKKTSFWNVNTTMPRAL